jgi:glycosyltransferase involved in cell wall biosynthesis
MSFADLTQEIALAERFGCKKASLVYFLYLDMISDRRKSCRALAAMPAPWSGLLFHPRAKGNSAALERYFHCANNRGCTFLNPDQTEAYRALMPGRTFVSLPDVTEMEIEPDFELAATIKARAGGRKIVLMIGSLSPHKGVMNFLEVVRLADAQRYFFALIGEVFWAQYGDDEPKLRAFVATPPSNCFVRTEYIEGDRGVNAVIAASDIMFAVYKDFPNSSNSLNKASIFEKPILVSAGNLMARRVNEDRMGESVPFGDPQAALAALDRLGARNKADFGFAKYRDAHSLEALQRQLAVMADGSLGRSESMAAE